MSGDHQSIGEVLATLRGDFPDITISKIRFLESQGLIDPERTPSGYRKFRDGDVARLRWILHQQKDNFLPLKVIKARLDEVGPDGLPADLDPPTRAGRRRPSDRDAGRRRAPQAEAAPKATAARRRRSRRRRRRHDGEHARDVAAPARPRATARSRPPPPAFETPMLPLDDAPADDLAAETSGASLTRAELLGRVRAHRARSSPSSRSTG